MSLVALYHVRQRVQRQLLRKTPIAKLLEVPGVEFLLVLALDGQRQERDAQVNALAHQAEPSPGHYRASGAQIVDEALLTEGAKRDVPVDLILVGPVHPKRKRGLSQQGQPLLHAMLVDQDVVAGPTLGRQDLGPQDP